MKKHLLLLAVMALFLYSCGPVYVVHQDPPPQAPPPADPEDVSYQNFYDQLSPYGQWIEDPHYGYVWLPDAGPDFKPYASNGHWVYTDEGWTWASDYPWGWAAFHYGRWFFQDGYGWMWLPGQEWSPAWVSWRNSPDYYGWAPLGPEVSINASFGDGYSPPPHYWSFVPHQYVTSPQIRNYYVNETRNVTIINNTTVINNNGRANNGGNNRNRFYAGGPDANEAGRYTGNTLRPIALQERHTPGEQVGNGSLTIYRPRVNSNPPANNPGNGGRPGSAPARVQPLNNARPVNTTIYNGDRRPITQPYNAPASQGTTRPFNQPANQPSTPPANQPATQPGSNPSTGQPDSRPFVRPGRTFPPSTQPANQPQAGQQPSGQPFNRQQPPNQQPSNQQPSGQPFNRQPSNNQQPPNQQPNNQQIPGRRLPNQQPAQPGGQPANQPLNRQGFNRNGGQPQSAQPAGRPVTSPNTPRPAPRQDSVRRRP
ncbi:MAG TPA: DUF6600 domain-containing protein [Puia sp.]|jgi:hypothetical protein